MLKLIHQHFFRLFVFNLVLNKNALQLLSVAVPAVATTLTIPDLLAHPIESIRINGYYRSSSSWLAIVRKVTTSGLGKYP